jgi:predicted permease
MEELTTYNLMSAIIQLLLLGGVGFFLFRHRVLDHDNMTFIARFLLMVSVPALILVEMAEGFDFSFVPPWWLFIVFSLIYFLIGLGICSLIHRCDNRLCRTPEVRMLSSFQNCGYLPMTIIYLLFSGERQTTLLVYTILYMFGYNILIWSAGSFYIFRGAGERFSLKSLFTPPVMATVVVFVFKILFGNHTTLPTVIEGPLKMLGGTTFPLSMLFLGGTLAEAGGITFDRRFLREIGLSAIIKLILIPAIALAVCVNCAWMPPMFGFFVMLQATMPSAVNVSIVTRFREGDYRFASQAVVVSHLASMLTIPLWIKLYMSLKTM